MPEPCAWLTGPTPAEMIFEQIDELLHQLPREEKYAHSVVNLAIAWGSEFLGNSYWWD